jgi:hypothetical protein
MQNTNPNVVYVGQGGPKGVQGVQGTQGRIGTGINILGSYATYSALIAAHPTGTQGDAYLITGILYVWSSNTWTNAGNIQGTQGVQGTTGAQGVQGTNGGGVTLQQLSNAISGAALTTTDDLPEGITNKYFTTSRVAYTHTQGVSSATWTINHNLGFYPNLTVQDSAGTIYEGEITYTDSVSLTVTFSSAFSGKAYLS